MEGQAEDRAAQAPQANPTHGWWADLRLLLVLLAFAAALRAWHLRHTEVAARDSISYIRYAWQLQHFPEPDTLRRFEQPPGYAVAVLAASAPVRHFSHLPNAQAMQLSAQLVSALASLLLVVPMFYLGKEIFGRGVGFGAALLFQCLPASGRILTDALSEPTCLLLCATALWLAARALRTGSPIGFAGAGLFGGLAYLTRPEGALVVLATGTVLLGTQLVGPWRRSWRRMATCGLALTVAALAVGGPYAAVIGGFTNKQSVGKIIEGTSPGENERPTDAELRTAGGPLFASTLGLFWPGPVEDRTGRVWWAPRALAFELDKGFHHAGWVPALLALWWRRDRFRQSPGAWLLLAVIVGMTVALWRLALIMGYLSERHALLLVLCGSFWSVAGLAELGRRVAGWCARRPWAAPVGRLVGDGRAWALLLLLALAGAALPKTLEPLHANRAGLRQAGLWLAEHAVSGDEIVDPYCWSHFYAGCVFRERLPTPTPPGHRPVQYVVLEEGSSEHVRLADPLRQARELSRSGQVVYHWSGKRGRAQAEVRVYRVGSGDQP